MFRRIRTAAALAVLAAIVALMTGPQASADQLCIPRTPITGQDICIDVPDDHSGPCDEREPRGDGTNPGQDPLCANGPSECIAVGLGIYTDPTIGLPGGASAEWSRSHAQAFAYGGFGHGHGDTAVQSASVPPALGEGVIESECDAYAQGDPGTGFFFNYATGAAETARLSLDLSSYGAPVVVTADVLKETGYASTGPVGSNAANIADLTIDTGSGPTPVGVPPAAPNTAIPLGPLGTLYLNEQFVTLSPFGCVVYSGDAMRLVLNRPVLGGTVTVLVSWVSNAAC